MVPEDFSQESVIQTAFQIEQISKSLYEAAAQKATDTAMAEIFQFFVNDEDEHIGFFQKIFDEMKCDSSKLNVAKQDDLVYLESLAKSPIAQGGNETINLIKTAPTDLEVVTQALTFEREAMLFFVKLYRLVCEDDRKSISKIVQAKESHIKQLNELQRKLNKQRPAEPGNFGKE